MRETPAFIQIVTNHSGGGYYTVLYGLTSAGEVFEWGGAEKGWFRLDNAKVAQ